MTNKQEHGVDTPKFEHNILKKGDTKELQQSPLYYKEYSLFW